MYIYIYIYIPDTAHHSPEALILKCLLFHFLSSSFFFYFTVFYYFLHSFLPFNSLSLSLSLYCNFRPCVYLLLVPVCTVGGNLCHCLTVQSTQRSIDQTCLQVLLQEECLALLLIDNSHLSFNWQLVMPARMPYDCCLLPHKRTQRGCCS